MNHITIELCAEDRARLDAILEALKKGADKADTQLERAVAEQSEEAQTQTDVKMEEIQRLVVTLATSGKKAEARDIVKAYAERVTDIPVDQYAEVYGKLKALEA